MGDITDAIDRIASGSKADSPTATNTSATGAAYLNDPKNRPAIMADAARIAAMRAGAAAAQAPAAAPAHDDGDSITGAIDRIAQSSVTTAQKVPAPIQQPGFFDRALAVPDAVASGITGAIGGLAGGATRLVMAKAGDELGNDSPSAIYGGAKAAGDAVQNLLTWKPHTQTGNALIADVSGVASKAKNALMSSPVGPALSSIGNAYDDTFVKGVAEKNPLMATVNDMLPGVAANVVAGKAGGAALDAARAAPAAVESVIGKTKASVKPGTPAPRVDPTLATPPTPAPSPGPLRPGDRVTVNGQERVVADVMAHPSAGRNVVSFTDEPNRYIFENDVTRPSPQPTPAPGGAPTSTLAGVGAASANLNPYAALSGKETARGGSSNFPQVKMSKTSGDVPMPEQVTRAQIANEILGPDSEAVRTGVRTGNGNTLVSEYTNAKSPENLPAQLALRDQIAREQSALSDYAQARIDATGASPNLTNNYQRGQVINDAFHGEDGLANYFKQAKQQIYDQAKAQSGNNPIPTGHVETLLADPQFLAEAERNGHGRVVSGAQKLVDLARNTGFKDPFTGEVHAPGSVAAWDAVRSSNNAGWTAENARTIAAINHAIDQDVAAAAGSEAYKLGDAIHGAEKTIMDTPAIARIFGGADANGIKDGVAMEQLPGKLNDMPLDKWTHVYNTLDDLTHGQVHGAPEGMPPVPTALRQQAQAAKNEMLGALARSVYESGAGKAGVWNQNSANKVLNSVVGQKIINTFPPDEVARFHALNYGGYIMPGVHSYEGAALQSVRMSKPTVTERLAGKAGATAGGAAAAFINPLTTGSGAVAGKWVGDKVAGRSAAKRVEGEANQLTAAMRANSRLGHRAGSNPLSGQ